MMVKQSIEHIEEYTASHSLTPNPSPKERGVISFKAPLHPLTPRQPKRPQNILRPSPSERGTGVRLRGKGVRLLLLSRFLLFVFFSSSTSAVSRPD